MNELERIMVTLGCSNLQPQERYQLTRKLVDLVRKDELESIIADVLPHCATCIRAWSMGAKHTIDYSATKEKP